MSFWGGTFLFLLFGIGAGVGVTFLSRPSHQGMNHILCGTAVLCCWMMWAILYVAQSHPLVRPVLQA